MAQTRPPSILPTVKCSNCSNDIQISQMGDHVCSGIGLQTESKSPVDFDTMRRPKSPEYSPTYAKTGMLLPRVDTNLSYPYNLQSGPFTPLSASPSPSSPGQSYFSDTLRSVSSPLPKAPQTIDLVTTNLECAFPPFPSTKNSLVKSPTKSPTKSPRGKHTRYPDAKVTSTAPVRKSVENDSFMQRIKEITPGPFDINSQRENQNNQTSPLRKDSISNQKNTLATKELNIGVQQSTILGHAHSRTSSSNSIGFKSNYSLPPKLPRKSGYDGFGPPREHEKRTKKMLSPGDRSLTFPQSNHSFTRKSSHYESYLSSGKILAPSEIPKFLASPLNSPRTPRIEPERLNLTLQPLLSNANSESMTNGESTMSASQLLRTGDEGNINPKSSVSSNRTPGQHSHKESNVDAIGLIMADLERSMSQLLPGKLRTEINSSNQPVVSPSLPSQLRVEQSEINTRRPSPSRQNTAPSLSPLPINAAMSKDHAPIRSQSQSLSQQTRPASRIKTSKGTCKGCESVIFGKSVFSADGRLTGRYHKECFVCQACSEPFKTATFYVIDDAPYCERHYHQLNGSICSYCDKGIEGACFETERNQKLHPACLSCVDCRRRLHYIYFEMNGNFYCERDANRHARKKRSNGPHVSNRDRIERRTTKMMMI